jgi:CBS domain containing-hemolysin-like protein
VINLVLLIVALAASAFFSGMETALISASRIQLKVWTRHNQKNARHALQLLQHPERFLTTTLVGTNIGVVTASFILAVYLEPHMSGFAITAISSVILLILGEMVPKSIGKDRATQLSKNTAYSITAIYYILYPLIWLVRMFSDMLLRIVGERQINIKQFFSRKDLDMLILQVEQAGLVDKEERGLISRFIRRGNEKVRDAMIHRTEISAVDITCTVKEAIKVFEKTGFSRLPVYQGTIDNILGIVTAWDIILEKPKNLKQILRDPLFVPEYRQISHLLQDFQSRHLRVAVVVDEYGGTAGLITFEDIIEEFFGEIQDEFDESANKYRKISPTQIDVHAKTGIQELNEQFALNLPEGDYQTLGGFLCEQLGKVPKRGDRLASNQWTMIVISATRKAVKWVRIMKDPA